jgi:Zn-dependent M28 family amino/carboxypeptidase
LLQAPSYGWQAGAPRIRIVDNQLIRDVRTLAADDMEGRRVGTPGGAKARAYILQRFKEIGLTPAGPSFEQTFQFRGRGDSGDQTGTNLVAVIRGARTPDRFIVVTAHYDHIGVRNGQVYNGADDNASGVAALLAIAEHFKKKPTGRSLVIAALDGEESGLQGARAFVSNSPVPKSAIAMNVNIDMIGRDAKNVLYAVGTYHYPALKPMLEGVAQPPVDLRLGHDVPNVEAQDWTRDSDHFPFHEAGIPFVYFGVEDFDHHHKTTDDAATIQRAFFAGAVKTIIAALEKFGQAAG